MITIPKFDKVEYFLEVLKNKEEYIALREFFIFSIDQATPLLPDTPTIDRDKHEMEVQRQRFQDEMEGAIKDKENIIKFIEKYGNEPVNLTEPDPDLNTK